MESDPQQRRRRAWLVAALAVAGLLAHLPLLDEPLLEGAAGKQTHTAMIARNFYRERATFTHPVVDDLGTPGYFVKELPVVPALAAALYDLTGGVDEALGRLVSLLGWLAGLPLLVALLGRARPDPAPLVAAAWWIAAPLAFVYARAFMSDGPMVTASLAALLALIRWRERPSAGRAAACGVLVAAALLLKPHAVFWIGAALPVVLRTSVAERAEPAAAGGRTLGAALAAGVLVAAAWYGHAALVHRAHPAPGATGLHGWFDAPTLLDPDLYGEILRQLVFMVLTPLGALVALAGKVVAPRGWHVVERALLAWGGGVLLQCLVFDTRMFDDFARGSEYYQLAMVPVAAMLLARSTSVLLARLPHVEPALRTGLVVALVVLLCAGSAREVRAALELPERYGRILSDCVFVRGISAPEDELFVLADRGGTILYYCDRRGTTFVPARAVRRVFARPDNVVGARQLADALDRSQLVYVPFPELLGERSSWLAHFEESWQRVPTPHGEMRLYRRPSAPARR